MQKEEKKKKNTQRSSFKIATCENFKGWKMLLYRRGVLVGKGLFPLGLKVDSQASRRKRRKKCCESVITLVNVITLHSLGLSESTTHQR